MAANTVLHAKTALSEQTKFSSLTQEVVRRLLHTSRRLPNRSRMECLEKFSQKMTNSDHRPNFIRKVLIAGITSYTTKVKNSLLPTRHPSYKPLHLGTNFNTMARWKKKVMARERWYKNKETTNDDTQKKAKGMKKESFRKDGNDNIQTTSVMFIPSRRGGLLTKMMREREQELPKITRFKVRMQESAGIQLARLFSTNLAKGEHCGRDDCHPCEGSDKISNCKQSSILYESRCKLCNPNLPSSSHGEQNVKRIGIYYGETSRTLYERSKEHTNDADIFTHGSHIIKHWMTSHADDQDRPEFIFRVLSSYKDCLSRQVEEAI